MRFCSLPSSSCFIPLFTYCFIILLDAFLGLFLVALRSFCLFSFLPFALSSPFGYYFPKLLPSPVRPSSRFPFPPQSLSCSPLPFSSRCDPSNPRARGASPGAGWASKLRAKHHCCSELSHESFRGRIIAALRCKEYLRSEPGITIHIGREVAHSRGGIVQLIVICNTDDAVHTPTFTPSLYPPAPKKWISCSKE